MKGLRGKETSSNKTGQLDFSKNLFLPKGPIFARQWNYVVLYQENSLYMLEWTRMNFLTKKANLNF